MVSTEMWSGNCVSLSAMTHMLYSVKRWGTSTVNFSHYQVDVCITVTEIQSVHYTSLSAMLHSL